MAKHREDARQVNGVTYTTTVENDGTMVARALQDVEPILDLNKHKRDEFRRYDGEFHQAASIPNVIVDQLMKNGIWHDPKRLKDWLNDPDNKAFRTSKGKI